MNVPAGESVTVRIPLTDIAGRTVYHCHILDHEDLGNDGRDPSHLMTAERSAITGYRTPTSTRGWRDVGDPAEARRAMRVVIVGGVAGGMSAATRLRRLDADASITVLERSGHVSFANCGLPYFVGGLIEEEEDLTLQTPQQLFARFCLDARVENEHAAGAIPDRSTCRSTHSTTNSTPLPAAPIVVNCEVGQRGHTATALMQELGIQARNLDGGYQTWRATLRAEAKQPPSAHHEADRGARTRRSRRNDSMSPRPRRGSRSCTRQEGRGGDVDWSGVEFADAPAEAKPERPRSEAALADHAAGRDLGLCTATQVVVMLRAWTLQHQSNSTFRDRCSHSILLCCATPASSTPCAGAGRSTPRSITMRRLRSSN